MSFKEIDPFLHVVVSAVVDICVKEHKKSLLFSFKRMCAFIYKIFIVNQNVENNKNKEMLNMSKRNHDEKIKRIY